MNQLHEHGTLTHLPEANGNTMHEPHHEADASAQQAGHDALQASIEALNKSSWQLPWPVCRRKGAIRKHLEQCQQQLAASNPGSGGLSITVTTALKKLTAGSEHPGRPCGQCGDALDRPG
jgi:hypothetical protein